MNARRQDAAAEHVHGAAGSLRTGSRCFLKNIEEVVARSEGED